LVFALIIQLEINEKIEANNNMNSTIINHKLATDSILLSEKAILPSQFEETQLFQLNNQKSQLKLLGEKTDLISSLKNIEFECTKRILDKNRVIQDLRAKMIENSQKLASEILEWENLYLFKSPINGHVEILGFIEDYQFIGKGREIFKILPVKDKIRGQIFIPSLGAGDIKIGAEIHIRLYDYPYVEYGYLKGHLVGLGHSTTVINAVPGYLGEIELDNGMTTSFGVELSFVHDMKGQADILTKKKKFISKIFNRLKYVIN
jgi:hypothetical protein